MAAVLGFGLDELERGVGEDGVVAPGGEQLALPGGRLVDAADAAGGKPGDDLQVLAFRGERRVGRLDDFGVGDPAAVLVVPDRLRVLNRRPGVFGDSGDRVAGPGGADSLGDQAGRAAAVAGVPAAQPGAAITGADSGVLTMAASTFRPRTSRELPWILMWPKPRALLLVPVGALLGGVDIDERQHIRTWQQRWLRDQADQNSRLVFSACRTLPQVNERRNEPGVDGARTPANSVAAAPCRSRPMPSMLPALAAMPATRHPSLRFGSPQVRRHEFRAFLARPAWRVTELASASEAKRHLTASGDDDAVVIIGHGRPVPGLGHYLELDAEQWLLPVDMIGASPPARLLMIACWGGAIPGRGPTDPLSIATLALAACSAEIMATVGELADDPAASDFVEEILANLAIMLPAALHAATRWFLGDEHDRAGRLHHWAPLMPFGTMY